MLIKVLIDRLGETCVFRLTFNSLYRLVFFNSIIIIIVPLNSIRVNQIKILLLNIFLIWWLVPLPLGVIVEFDLFLEVALGCLHWEVSLCFLNEFFDCFFGVVFDAGLGDSAEALIDEWDDGFGLWVVERFQLTPLPIINRDVNFLIGARRRRIYQRIHRILFLAMRWLIWLIIDRYINWQVVQFLLLLSSFLLLDLLFLDFHQFAAINVSCEEDDLGLWRLVFDFIYYAFDFLANFLHAFD